MGDSPQSISLFHEKALPSASWLQQQPRPDPANVAWPTLGCASLALAMGAEQPGQAHCSHV